MIVKILKCDCKETIDDATIEFLHINSNKYRNSILRSMLKGSKTNYTALKYFARFFANLNPYFKDFTQEIVSNLMEEFNLLMRQDKVTNLDERIRNIRFACELIKFDLFPVQNTFDILKKIIDDFKGYAVDILCSIFENAGRYLYLNDLTHVKFSAFIENIKQMAYHSQLFNLCRIIL
jgi:regulator of nonsense transcripts 2